MSAQTIKGQAPDGTYVPILVDDDGKILTSGGGGGAVDSVNGQTGVVVLDAEDVLPDQTGNNGKFLTTDGSASSWATLAGGGDMAAATYDPANIAEQVVGTTATQTVTNKRVTARTGSTTSSATPSINTDNVDEFDITALAANITSMTTNLTGTPVNGDELVIRIKDNGTSRTIVWGASFVSSGVATLLAATSVSKTHYVKLRYDSTAAKWVCLAVDAVGY